MSNYCRSCYYGYKLKTGDRACPFNSLYWDFLDRHRALLETKHRIGMAYKTWDKMQPAMKESLLRQAAAYRNCLDEL
ncbi:MAG: cryptochrome/photolyase family protein, partial [Bacteroidetes bacterium]|nr:cryptochrome/photolyase family protein [Bacteroidota bacterium]